MSNDAPQPIHPFLKKRIESGRQSDGTYVLNAQFRFTPKDEVGLRAAHLIDSERVVTGDVPPDAGLNMAILNHFTQAIAGLDLSPFDVKEVSVNCDPGGGSVPAENFQ